MPFEIWDVIDVAAFPNQENLKETTTRPAIIIEDLQDEALICPITKQLHQAANYKYTIQVNKNSVEAKQMGLTFDSIIVLDRHTTLKKIRLRSTNCSCPQIIIDKIEELIQKMKDDGIKTI